MFSTVCFKASFKPTVNRAIMIDDIVIEGRLKLVGVENLNGALLPTSSDGLACSEVDLDVDHVMGKGFETRVVVFGAVENQIARLKVLISEIVIGKEIELIRLVPLSKCVAELLS